VETLAALPALLQRNRERRGFTVGQVAWRLGVNQQEYRGSLRPASGSWALRLMTQPTCSTLTGVTFRAYAGATAMLG